MINWIYCFIFEMALLISGMIYGHTRERREEFFRRFLLGILVYIGICLVGNLLMVNHMMELSARIIGRSVGFLLLFGFHQWCLRVDWTISAYDTIWAAMSWQLIYELWSGISMARGGIFFNGPVRNVCGIFLSFLVGHVVAYYTIARFLPEGGGKRIGPRQLASAALIFFTFEFIGFDAGGAQTGLWEAEFLIVYLSQLMLALILYLQNELFKKSALRQELAVMNLLWKKEGRFRNRLDPLFWVSAPLCRAAEAHKLSYRSFRRFAIAMPYFGQKIKSTLHKERALRSVDLTKQTITLVIRIIAAFCDGYVKKQFASMNKM